MRKILAVLTVAISLTAACGDADTADPAPTTSAPANVDGSLQPEPDEPVLEGDDLIDPGESGDEPTDDTVPRPLVPGSEAPPPIVITGNGAELTLVAWTTCWTNYCADGAPPADDDLALVVGDEPLLVEFPIEGWEFSATGRTLDEECGRQQTVELESTDATTFSLAPFGLAGDRAVNLFGRGPGGDVIVSFRWQTGVDGELPVPSASLSLLALHDGEVDSYGVEFPIRDLATTPSDIAASVMVTSADGASKTIELEGGAIGCTGEGSLFLTAPLAEGVAAAALGSWPFTYDVTLELDGVTHVAHHTWPDDVDLDCSPCVPLSFDPPLPAMGAS